MSFKDIFNDCGKVNLKSWMLMCLLKNEIKILSQMGDKEKYRKTELIKLLDVRGISVERTINNLLERNLIERENIDKYFIYNITELGEKALDKMGYNK